MPVPVWCPAPAAPGRWFHIGAGPSAVKMFPLAPLKSFPEQKSRRSSKNVTLSPYYFGYYSTSQVNKEGCFILSYEGKS